MNLRLDDGNIATQATRDLAGFGGRGRNLAARHRNAEAREYRLGLVFVNFHGSDR